MNVPPNAPPGGPMPPRKPPPGGPFHRRKPAANPLVARKRPLPKPAPVKPQDIVKKSDKQKLKEDKEAVTRQFAAGLQKLEEKRRQNNGWSQDAPPEAQEFKLVTTKRAMREGMRYHIMRLNHQRGQESGEGSIDVTDQDQFPRPVTLHRRDPRQVPAHKLAQMKDEDMSQPTEDPEVERIRQQKAEREAQRLIDQAQIAPSMQKNEPKRKVENANKKPKVSTFYGRNSDEQKKQSSLRYEETLPWHLEDVEGKAGVWVGSYIDGLSHKNCALVVDGQNFRMIPLERYYRFDEKPKFTKFSLEEAENMMKAKKTVKRWVMADMERNLLEKEKSDTRHFIRGPPRVKTESATSRAAPKTERLDDYELDMSGDEFQDDDETPGFEADDEDTKDTKTRMRREALGANLFGDGEESKVDEEEREKQLEKLKKKTMGKKTMKDLMKLEHTMDYEDMDSDGDENNPFTDSSDSESDPEEKKKEEEEAKKQAAEGKEPIGSGTASKGTTTPSGKQKAVEALKKGKGKRPGSPNLSESSDNESSRKKMKVTKNTSSVVPSRSGTPLPGRPKGVGVATSDGEATGGEGSDGGLRRKKKPKGTGATGATGTPSGSRATSPAPPNTLGMAPGRGDPATPRGSPPPPSGPIARIEASEITQAIAERGDAGISLGDLLRVFVNRLNQGATTKGEWLTLVKQNAVYGPDKLLRLRPV
ncbi:hypothetical protein QBC39DRAFT_13527 [Podospora conica]|nr:hypothetical protein QBC39DRAFT_13527 [Schizothecium conicum]